MSLLLDALNRAQKTKETKKENNKESSEDSIKSEISSDNVNSSAPLDMEGLELTTPDTNKLKAASNSDETIDDKTNDSELKQSYNSIEQSNHTNDIAVDNNVVEFSLTEFSSQQQQEELKSNIPDETGLKSDVNTDEQATTSIEPSGLSLEEMPNLSEKNSTDAAETTIDKASHKPRESSNSSTPITSTASLPVATLAKDQSDIDKKSEQNKTPVKETDILYEKSSNNTQSQPNKAIVESSPKTIKSTKSIDVEAIRKKRKLQKAILYITTAIGISLSVVFAGLYYYNDQLGKIDYKAKQYAGRSLTPIGTEPLTDESSQLTGKVTDDSLPGMKESITDATSHLGPETAKVPLIKKIASIEKSSSQKPPLKVKTESTKNKQIQSREKPKLKPTPRKPAIKTVKPPKANSRKNRVSQKSLTKPNRAATKKSAPTPRNQVNKQKIAKKPASSNQQEKSNPTHTLLLSAFNAFQIGDDSTARETYFEVLKTEVNNRDALLGLGAISVRQKQLDLARQYYTRILRSNQNDSVARAALVGLVGQMDPVKAESELKLMLNKEPGAGFLHFALGNIYALQQRWLNAQNSFFNAYHIDNNNADYAYNVAVSLDHLGERKTAREYYQKAIAVKSNKSISFDVSLVKKRIDSLNYNASGSKQ